jgi:hypothetical protein
MHTAKLQKKSSKNAWGKLLFFSESILNTSYVYNTKSTVTMHCGGWEDGIRKAARQLEWLRLGRWLCTAAAVKMAIALIKKKI